MCFSHIPKGYKLLIDSFRTMITIARDVNTGTMCSPRRIDDSIEGEKTSPLNVSMGLNSFWDLLAVVCGLKMRAKREIKSASPM